MIEEKIKDGSLHVPGFGTTTLSHLVFADDLLLFMKPSISSTKCITTILDHFYSCSGLLLNASKSKVFIGAKVQHKKPLLDALKVQEGNLPSTYLGLPLFSTRLSRLQCTPILQKITRRIASWKTRLWPLRIIIRLVLHFGEVERLLRNFFWHALGDYKPFHLVKWDHICRPIDEGGLGLRSLHVWNSTLITMQFWRLLSNTTTLWHQWVAITLGTCLVCLSMPSWIWMQILHRLEIHRRPRHTIFAESQSLTTYLCTKGAGRSVAFFAFRAALWWIWKERCSRIFDSKDRSSMQFWPEITYLEVDLRGSSTQVAAESRSEKMVSSWPISSSPSALVRLLTTPTQW
ncbi:hypothetical protein Taro_037740 [Colocasia esculenta]|uniref:Reverse transcriptase domain-containing protein n=1 Tax=Colocasia esculenta TaxID=4460 RepID=A0A843WAP2_COLES|nr:hypothetical protein [Colocasia esculenta]